MEHGTLTAIKRTGLAGAFVIGPVLMAIGHMAHPRDGANGAETIQIAASHPTAWNVAHLAILCSIPCLIAVAMRLMAVPRGRAAWFGLLGGVMTTLGLVFLAALMGMDGLVISALAALPEDQRADFGAGYDAFVAGNGIAWTYQLTLLFILGFFVLGIGLFAARTLPRWIGAVVVIGAVGFAVSFAVPGGYPVGLAGSLLWLIGFGSIALRDLRSGGVPEPASAAVSAATA